MKIKSYLITDPSYFGDTPESLTHLLGKAIQVYQPDFITLRDKENTDYKSLAKVFLSLKGTHKSLLHGHVDLAIELGAFGVHLTSHQFDEIERAKAAGLYVVVSTHSYDEAQQAKMADAITYSPIFFSPNKGKPKGLGELKEIVGKIETKIFALGGIVTKEQIEQVKSTGAYGFASIRYFAQDA